MIVFETISVKNFLGIGNNGLFMTLNEHPTTLIAGKNGKGKSTIEDALAYALYGRAYRKINVPELVNNTNKKNMLVTLTFKIGNRNYKIVRGISPNIFEIWIDGELKEQLANKRDYQTFLEDNILKMNWKTFRQIVVLGSSMFVPFMKLNAADRRLVVEEILDIQIFSFMLSVVNRELTLLTEEIKSLKQTIETTAEKIELTKKHLAEISSHSDKFKEEIEKDIGECRAKIKDAEYTIATKREQMLELEKLIDGKDIIVDKKSKISSYRSSISTNRGNEQKELKFFETNDACPVCLQHIDDDFKKEKISEKHIKISKYEEALEKSDEMLAELSCELDNMRIVTENILAINSDVRVSENIISNMKTRIDSLEKRKSARDFSQVKESEKLLNSFEAKYDDSRKKKSAVDVDAEYYALLAEILKDKGVKAKVIRNYLPIINKLIRKFLDILEFSCEFTFDESFQETIRLRYRDKCSYGSLSDGQKLRIDLSLLFAWRELSRIKNCAATNLVILDEIGSSSLDIEGFEAFDKIIRETTSDGVVNAIIISHDERIADKYDNIISVTTDCDGFSSYEMP